MRIKSVMDLPEPARGRAQRQMNAQALSELHERVLLGIRIEPKPAGKPKKPSKYGNHRQKYDGITFDSKAELARYVHLKAMEAAGLIRDVKVHPAFPLHTAAGVVVGHIEPDFTYRRCTEPGVGLLVVEDVKSPATLAHPLFIWKRKHFEAEYHTVIHIVMKGKKR